MLKDVRGQDTINEFNVENLKLKKKLKRLTDTVVSSAKQSRKEGYIFIDDISHLPYLKDQPRNNFYCEINNKETFKILLSIYSKNIENFELNFSFMSSGLAIIKKLNNNNLSTFENLNERSWTFKNILRKLWRKIKRD